MQPELCCLKGTQIERKKKNQATRCFWKYAANAFAADQGGGQTVTAQKFRSPDHKTISCPFGCHWAINTTTGFSTREPQSQIGQILQRFLTGKSEIRLDWAGRTTDRGTLEFRRVCSSIHLPLLPAPVADSPWRGFACRLVKCLLRHRKKTLLCRDEVWPFEMK